MCQLVIFWAFCFVCFVCFVCLFVFCLFFFYFFFFFLFVLFVFFCFFVFFFFTFLFIILQKKNNKKTKLVDRISELDNILTEIYAIAAIEERGLSAVLRHYVPTCYFLSFLLMELSSENLVFLSSFFFLLFLPSFIY